MARNGSGTYVKTHTAVGGVVIPSSAINTQIDDIGNEITNSIPRDGQAAPTADIPMGTYKLTNVGNAAARNQYAAAGQVQDSAFMWGGTAGGTADALTINLTPSITGYTTGMIVRFIVASTNTGAATLSVSGLAAKNLLNRSGTAIAGGDQVAGDLAEYLYDGTAFRALGGVNYISQAMYDALYPVDGPIQLRYDTVDPNTTLPTGITATWAELALSEIYAMIDSTKTPGTTGGSATASGAIPNHTHDAGTLATDASGSTVNIATSFTIPVSQGAHTHDITGSTGDPDTTPDVDVTILPEYISFRGWRRTA